MASIRPDTSARVLSGPGLIPIYQTLISRARLQACTNRLRRFRPRDHACASAGAFLRVSGGFFPNPLAYQDLDAYAAAWRDAIVKELLGSVALRRPPRAAFWSLNLD